MGALTFVHVCVGSSQTVSCNAIEHVSQTATIGGLLVALPKEQAQAFCQELEVSEGV